MSASAQLLVFAGDRLLAHGGMEVAVRAAHAHAASGSAERLAVYDDWNARPVDLDLRGTADEAVARALGEPEPAPVERRAGPGRPRLGVVSREVSLLPRHWEWLANQPGGASAALRRVVEEARKAGAGDGVRKAREAAYRLLVELGGDRPGFEEASRALFAGDEERLAALIAAWPEDVRAQVLRFAARARGEGRA